MAPPLQLRRVVINDVPFPPGWDDPSSHPVIATHDGSFLSAWEK